MTEQLTAGARSSMSRASTPPSMTEPDLTDHVLNPDARILWRSSNAIQVELGTRRLVLEHITSGHVRALTTRRISARSVFDDDLAQAREELAREGFLVPAANPRSHVGPPRLAREIGAVRTQRGDQATQVLMRRQESVVVVAGPGRLSVLIGSLLASAGVGHVHVHGTGTAQLSHCVPGALTSTDEGRLFDVAAADALHRVAPEVEAGPPDPEQQIDLMVLASGLISDLDQSAALVRAKQTHLFAWAGGDHAVIGPMVIPGLTSCLNCAEENRRERDPAWPVLAAQLAIPTQYPSASEVCLVVSAAGIAAAQALAHLDGDAVATLEGSLHLQAPDWRVRRRSWPRHSACGCVSTHLDALSWQSD